MVQANGKSSQQAAVLRPHSYLGESSAIGDAVRRPFPILLEQILNNNLISPTDAARQIDGIVFSSPNLGTRQHPDIVPGSDGCVTELLRRFPDIGIKTVFTPATHLFTVTLYKGTDSQAVFSGIRKPDGTKLYGERGGLRQHRSHWR